MNGKQGKPDPHDTGSSEQKRKVSGKVHVEGEVVVHFPPDVKKENRAAYQKSETRETVKQVVEGLTLIFVVIVAFINFWQGYEATKAANAAVENNKQSERNFRIDAAPYIDFVETMNVSQMDGSEFFQVKTKNFGRTPAVTYKAVVVFRLIPLYKQIVVPKLTESMAKGNQSLAPGNDAAYRAEGIITKEQAAAYHTAKLQAYAHVGMWYVDIWGNHHDGLVCILFEPIAQAWVYRAPDCKS